MTSASAVCSPGLQEAIKQMTLVPHVVMRLSLFLCWIVTSMFLHTCQDCRSILCGNNHNNFVILFSTFPVCLQDFKNFLSGSQISYWISTPIYSVTGLGVSLSYHKFPFSDCVFHRLKHWFMGNCKIPQRVTIIYLQVNNLKKNSIRGA